MPEYLTTDEAAARSHRHPGSIRRALEGGSLHGSQTGRGGRWLIQPDCLDAYLAGERCKHRQPSNVRPFRKAVS